jgi:hypothetical protein
MSAFMRTTACPGHRSSVGPDLSMIRPAHPLAEARKAPLRQAAWIAGDGPFALVAHAHHQPGSLWESKLIDGAWHETAGFR